MKPNSLKIITTQKDQHLKIGTLPGGRGLETLANLPNHATPEQVEDITRSWPDLLHTPLDSKINRDALEDAIKKLCTPAPAKWVTGRIASLLSQYYIAELPANSLNARKAEISADIMTSIADDWYSELKVFPAWSIAKAVRWWIGKDNPDRRKKPMAGDIAERAQKELGPIIVARTAVKIFDRGHLATIAPPPKERISKERANEIMAQAGFSVKKFGGSGK